MDSSSSKPTQLPQPKRLIAIGDVHGDFDASKEALTLAGVIDASGTWVGGETVVIQLGDQLDRGNEERSIIDMFEKLETDAKAAGGGFYWLIGNHEVMNARIDFRYVTKQGFLDFDEYKQQADGDLQLANLPVPEKGRGAAFRPGGIFARRLSGNNVVMKIGDSVFVHGGLQKKYAEYGIEKINKEMRQWLVGDKKNPPKYFDDDSGPLWDRSYGTEVNASGCKKLKETLKILNAARMIIAHTVQDDGISARCDNQVWRVDTGMSDYYGGPVEVLEILASGQITVLKN